MEQETITLDKKVLMDLLSHVAMVASEASNGVILSGHKTIPEHFAFVDSDKLPHEVREHMEMVLGNYIYELLYQPNVLAEIKCVTNYVSQAVLRDNRADIPGAIDAISRAEFELPNATRAIKDFAKSLRKLK